MSRRWIARFAAPAAFLAGVTVAVLLVRSGLADEDTNASPQPTLTAPTQRTTTATATRPRPRPVFARVQAGDTLDQIALEHDTSVERLLELNPGLDPNALQVGQRVRVR